MVKALEAEGNSIKRSHLKHILRRFGVPFHPELAEQPIHMCTIIRTKLLSDSDTVSMNPMIISKSQIHHNLSH
jgi:hypothetical protein